LNDPENREYLSAPARAYGVRNPIVPLPATPGLPRNGTWLQDNLRGLLAKEHDIYLMIANMKLQSQTKSVAEYMNLLHQWGLRGRVLYAGEVWVLHYRQ
jgi:hypothetical protein